MKTLLKAALLLILWVPAHADTDDSDRAVRAANYLTRGLDRRFLPEAMGELSPIANAVEYKVHEWEKTTSYAVAMGNKLIIESFETHAEITELGLTVLRLKSGWTNEEKILIEKLISKVYQARFAAGLSKFEIDETPPEPPMW